MAPIPIPPKEASKLDWLKSRPDMQTPEGQKLLGLFDMHNRSIGDKMDPLFPWLAREVKKGRLRHELGHTPDEEFHGGLGKLVRPLNVEERQEFAEDPQVDSMQADVNRGDLSHLADWYGSNSASRRGTDLMQLKWPDMEQKIHEWEEEMKAAAEERAKRESEEQRQGGEIVHTTPDNWTVRKLAPENLQWEADRMKSENGYPICVGDPGYQQAVGNGTTQIYSLRDPEGYPHTTLEIEPHPGPQHGYGPWAHAGRGKIQQIQGQGNSQPKPEYQARLKDWFTSFPEEERPYWEGEEDSIRNVEDLHNHWGRQSTKGEIRDLGEGNGTGYNPHGDYGVASNDGIYDVDYRQTMQDVADKAREVDWNRTSVDTDDLNELYNWAYHRNEIPTLADQLEDWGDDQQNNFDEWRDQNYEYTVPCPQGDEEYPLDPREEWGPYFEGAEPIESAEEHEKMYDQDITNSEQGHPGMQATSYMYKLLAPHYGERQEGIAGGPGPITTQGYRNELQKQPVEYNWENNAIPWKGHPAYQDWQAQKSGQEKLGAVNVPPLYYRWTFSPTKGVALSDNEGHPAFVPYHRDTSGAMGEAGLYHGYAYRIGDGWRLTTEEHQPVTDPYLVSQVVNSLVGKEGHQSPLEAFSRAVAWDFDRTHYGIPMPLRSGASTP